MNTRQSLCAVLIRTSYYNARKECEYMEGDTFLSPPDYKGSESDYIKGILLRDKPDLNQRLHVVRMTDFMDLLNNDGIDIAEYFMSYVQYKKEIN
jgi:hypothetical protein